MRWSITLGILLLFSLPAWGVDGVIEINQAEVSGNVNTLHVISAPGSYRLTGDLVASEGLTGIRITASDVTLDLNGFTLSGSGSEFTDGISAQADNVEVRNGTVRGFGRHGVTSTANGTRIIEVRTKDNTFSGVHSDQGLATLVRGCTSANNGAAGIRVLATGSLVFGNVVAGNTGFGLQLGAATGFGQNVLTGNNEGNPQISSGEATACNLVESTLVCPP